ncbi:MAG: PaaI family thioesterase, partial [Alphaproteobacteria bacterium]|nr:PaaI family thioesterase [Alphaproteobacteria bacterium]
MSETSTPPHGYKRVPIDRGFAALIGPSYYREADGRLFYRFATGPEHANVAGLVHGGLLMTLADNILGGTVWRAIDKLR